MRTHNGDDWASAQYADYFAISMGYIFVRYDDSHDMLYEIRTSADMNNSELREFTEMFRNSELMMNKKLKEEMTPIRAA